MTDMLPAIRQDTKLSIPSEHEMMVYHTMAKSACESKMYKGIGEQAGVMMIMLAARELGIPPMQALNGGLNIIQGKVEISARMMNALIRKSGHQITIKESTDASCVLVGKRCDTGESQETSFTIADAQKAGLIKTGGGWTKFPKDMCFARALSRLARQLFSDVIGIGYVEGEIKAIEAEAIVQEPIQIEEPATDFAQDEVNRHALFYMFEKEEHILLEEYIHIVMKYYGWTKQVCISKLVEDGSCKVKFNNWKSKKVEASNV